MDKFVTDALAVLRNSGCRITQPRVKLLMALAERTEPVTVEELHGAVGEPECNLVTVYRCLTMLEDLGVIARTYRHNGTTLYERKRGGLRPYRVVCKVSNRVTEVDPALAAPIHMAIEQVEENLRAQGYTQVSHVLEFFVVDPKATPNPSDRPPRS